MGGSCLDNLAIQAPNAAVLLSETDPASMKKKIRFPVAPEVRLIHVDRRAIGETENALRSRHGCRSSELDVEPSNQSNQLGCPLPNGDAAGAEGLSKAAA